MCDPITAIAVISAGAGIFGQVKAASAQKNAAGKQQASYNKVADARLEKVTYDLAQLKRGYTLFKGTERASIGQTGLSATSFYDVIADNAAQFAVAKKAVVYSGNKDAEQLREQGSIAFSSGAASAQASQIGAVNTALGAVGSIYASSPFQKSGGWTTTTTNAAGQII